MKRVLVTGGSGFIAGHIILQLLDAGYEVRTTVRSLRRENDVRAVLTAAGMTRGDALTFAEAELTKDDGWRKAVQDIDVVLHVASPILHGIKDENEVIRPAREGALRVLRAATRAGVKRVVLTSAFHAVGFGHQHDHSEFTEQDWSVTDSRGVDAYGKSKILAERAAWDFITREGGAMELVAILPVAVMGPVLGNDVSGANHIVQRSLNGQMPGYPNMYIPIVDVRDVAAAHVAAVEAPGAAGQRILVATGEPAIAMKEIGAILKDRLGDAAAKVPNRTIPDFVVRLSALFNAEFRPVAHDLNFVKQVSNANLRTILGIRPRPSRDAVIGAAESMLAKSLVRT